MSLNALPVPGVPGRDTSLAGRPGRRDGIGNGDGSELTLQVLRNGGLGSCSLGLAGGCRVMGSGWDAMSGGCDCVFLLIFLTVFVLAVFLVFPG